MMKLAMIKSLMIAGGKIVQIFILDMPRLKDHISFDDLPLDDPAVYQLFAQPSTALQKVAQTKLWDKPGGYQFSKFVTRFWGIVKYYSGLSPTLNVAIDNETSSNTNAVTAAPSPAVWTTPSGAISTWTTVGGLISTWLAGGAGSYSVLAPEAVAGAGVLTGFTVTTNAADMAIVSMMIQDSIAGYRG